MKDAYSVSFQYVLVDHLHIRLLLFFSMIDPILSLAFSIHSNPGVYALLLGSGVSRTAEIPTGWEIILDLIRRLAHLEEEDCEPNPGEWYREKYDEEPSYSRLLDQLARSPEERNQLLRPYFEPNEERERGAKLPTEAHKAIAQLVADGAIRVIITTNFDRLLEQALESIGITPTVISSPDAAEGALPLTHSPCTIVKVHGDYVDTRIKNTPEELEEYDERINRLLDQIFDEYGLITCGWSGEWDTALIAALERCESRRFTTYWAAYQGNVSDNAERLVELRGAEIIPIDGADSFFGKLNEKVAALREFDRPHPLSAKLAVTSLKRYIVSERHKISLHDLVVEEIERVTDGISSERFSAGEAFSQKELVDRVKNYEGILDILLPLVIHGCYWGEEQHRHLWERAIGRVANKVERRGGKTVWLNLRFYPALVLLYGGGIAAIAGGKYENLLAILKNPSIHVKDGDSSPLYALYTYGVMEERVQKSLPEMERRKTPLSDHLHDLLRDPLRDLLPGEQEYDDHFDKFEYLRCLLYIDAEYDDLDDYLWGPVGRFAWRNYSMRGLKESSTIQKVESEAIGAGENWGPIKCGAFNGSIERFRSVKEAANDVLVRIARGW